MNSPTRLCFPGPPGPKFPFGLFKPFAAPYSPSGELTALVRQKRLLAHTSSHRLRRGLPGYL